MTIKRLIILIVSGLLSITSALNNINYIFHNLNSMLKTKGTAGTVAYITGRFTLTVICVIIFVIIIIRINREKEIQKFMDKASK
jgi:hypothetical protein